MGQASKFLRRWANEAGGYSFYCPGCKEAHAVSTEGPKAWKFNGRLDAPTFEPSVLLRSGHFADGFKPGDRCWCTFNAEQVASGKEPSSFKCTICHSFVTDGKIQFLPDSTHALSGQTVPLPELPPWMRDDEPLCAPAATVIEEASGRTAMDPTGGQNPQSDVTNNQPNGTEQQDQTTGVVQPAQDAELDTRSPPLADGQKPIVPEDAGGTSAAEDPPAMSIEQRLGAVEESLEKLWQDFRDMAPDLDEEFANITQSVAALKESIAPLAELAAKLPIADLIALDERLRRVEAKTRHS